MHIGSRGRGLFLHSPGAVPVGTKVPRILLVQATSASNPGSILEGPPSQGPGYREEYVRSDICVPGQIKMLSLARSRGIRATRGQSRAKLHHMASNGVPSPVWHPF
jgi:hypothetical protein